jgi:Ca-activated chloride channel family protein
VTELAEAARRKATLSGPSTLGPAGPSTPGPRGPATPSFPRSGYSPAPPASNTAVELAGSDDFFLGHGERRTRREYRYEVGGDFDFESIDLGELTPAQIDALCERRTQRILQDCRRHDGEHPRDMFFRFWGDNPFELARLDNQSTFGVDVDTASYALARRYLQGGNLPTKAQIRTEEFVNYFKPDLAPPSEGDFRIHTELATSRFGNEPGAPSQRWMLRVGVRGREVAPEDRKPLALTFVVDTSGSMKEGNRLELVKHALRLLVGQLHGSDSIAIVGFNNSASLILPLTSAQNRGLIEAAIYGLSPNGGTNAESGLRLGYEVASAGLTPGAHNRVVLLSDGVANIGQTDQDRVNADVKRRRDEGIYLNTIGVGMSNHNDVFLEQLANKGDGLCNYVDSAAEARRALVDNFMGAFEPIARDVKIQVEFDSNQVYRYRLLGYENRAIADADFRNDVVDAGEIGAGHQVVALYELELTGSQSSEPLATVRLRWKEPTGPGRDPLEDGATEMAQPVSFSSATTWEGAPQGYRRSALVAQFAEILRRSVHARSDSLDELMAETSKLVGPMGDSDLLEFLTLLQTSRELILRHTPQYDDLSHCIDSIRRNRILHAQYEELRRTEKVAVLSELEHANQELEQRIRDLIRKELQEKLR